MQVFGRKTENVKTLIFLRIKLRTCGQFGIGCEIEYRMKAKSKASSKEEDLEEYKKPSTSRKFAVVVHNGEKEVARHSQKNEPSLDSK